MPRKTYDESIQWLFEQFPSYQKLGAGAYKPGLERTQELCKLLDHPEQKLRFIHLAGTNGKGSTASMLAHVFTEAGYTVGLFTSPHLEDFRERIRVNGKMIPEEQVNDFVEHIQQHTPPSYYSFFEITFGMALKHFAESKCDICILETGMGGRLDSTNIVNPEVSVITNIGLDHQQFFGDNIAAIAKEKAGIIKKGTPIIISEYQEETFSVFEAIAQERNASLHKAFEQPLPGSPDILPGKHQQSNWRCAQEVLKLCTAQFPRLKQSLDKISWENFQVNTGLRARLQKVSTQPEIYIDAAHNLDGIRQLLDHFEEKIKKYSLRFIYGTSSDKDLESIFKIFPKEVPFHFTKFNSLRSASLENIEKEALKNGLAFYLHESIQEALQAAKEKMHPEESLVVFGSFFLIEDFFKIKLP